MNKKKIIERIRKLLAMAASKSYNPNEASVATEHAQRLLHKYNITLSEVEAKEIQTFDVLFNDDGSYIDDYKLILANQLEKVFGVKILILGNDDKHVGLRYVGGGADIEVAKYTFDFLIETVESLYKEKIKPKEEKEEPSALRDWLSGPISGTAFSTAATYSSNPIGTDEASYKFGITKALCSKLLGMVPEDPSATVEKVEKGSNAIIHIKKQALKKYISDLNIDSKTQGCRKEVTDPYAFLEGEKDGKNVEIRKGIN